MPIHVSHRPQALSHRSRLILGMVTSVLFVRTSVENDAVETVGHKVKLLLSFSYLPVMNRAYEEIIDWLVGGFTPEALVAYRPSEMVRERVADLI